MKANNVLKYLRCRNIDAAGNSPPHDRGEVLDLAIGAVFRRIPVWEPDDRGQVGNFGQDTFDWSWRERLASVHLDDLVWILGGSHVLSAGCGPLNYTQGPRPRMTGPSWDFVFILALALAGLDHRVVWLHPSSQGDLKCMSDDLAPNRFAHWSAVRSKGRSAAVACVVPDAGSA